MLGSGNDYCAGLTGDDVIFGAAGSDTLDGGAGRDRLAGGMGDDDLLDGGEGTDTAGCNGPAARYRIEETSTGWRVTDSAPLGNLGVDLLTSIERLQFSDSSSRSAEPGGRARYQLTPRPSRSKIRCRSATSSGSPRWRG